MKRKVLSILALLLTAVTQSAWAQTGMTNGLFSVSATKRVYFSKGNLQLVGENTFQFAENQWDYFGSNQSDNHRDLFSWGTGNNPNQTTGNSTFTDWGDNTYLQATLGKGWRTMTKDEFVYVFNTRASGSSVFGNANGRYTTATINTDGTGVNGLILFPDGITIAASEVTTAGTINSKGTVTQCTTAQWAALAEKGCVFLPAAGYSLNASGAGYGDITDYWSSTAADASKAYNLSFNFGYSGAVVNTAGSLGYNYRCSVRLVIDPPTYDLTLADGSDDATSWQGKAGEGEYQSLPLTGLEAGTAVTVKYNGTKKVKSVKAKKKAAPATARTLAEATAEDIGKIAGADGNIYDSKDAAVTAGTTAVAIIAYVGSETGEASPYNHGLAIAMKDASAGYWKTSYGSNDNPNRYDDPAPAIAAKESGSALSSGRNNSTWPAFEAALANSIDVTDGISAAAPASVTSGWFLPSLYQWNMIVKGLSGQSADLSWEQNDNYTASSLNTKIEAAGGTGLQSGNYWSSTECDGNNAWFFLAEYGCVQNGPKDLASYYVRSAFAF